MKLYYKTVGEGQPLIILHGLFGSSDNWTTIAKSLAEKIKVYLVDLRNHGQSPHEDVFDYAAMSEDLQELFELENISSANILGHSMGGKAAMYFACQNPEKVEKLIVADIGPKAYPPHHQDIIAGFNHVDVETLSNRKEADERLSEIISNLGIRMFLLKNLKRNTDGSFSWKHNLKVIEEKIEEVGKALPNDFHFEGQTLFIKGEKSQYIMDEDLADIQGHFPNYKLEAIPNAGHWVHAEQPKLLLETLEEFLL